LRGRLAHKSIFPYIQIMIYLYLIAGFLLLIFGAKILVHASSKLAAIMGLSPLIIGLTIVAYGTNSPELFVSTQSVIQGKSEIAIGNVVGSNIFNILGVLGISALIAPIRVCESLFRFDIPIMILASILFLLLCLLGKITPLIGILLLVLAVIYTYFTVRHTRTSSEALKEEYAQEYSNGKKGWKKLIFELALIAISLVMLVFGSEWFVKGASGIARMLGISDVIIGLTLVAIGSSLPELATSVYAVIKKEYDIAVGNIIGSNIFNILGVMGFASLFNSEGVNVSPILLKVDVPLMLIAACLCVPLVKKGTSYGRWKGGALFLLYCINLLYTISDPTGAQIDSNFLFGFSCFLAVLSLVILRMRAKRV